MGVPDRPSPGKHGLAGSAGGQGQPREGVPPKKGYILTFRNSLDPASLLKTKRKRIRTQRSQDCLPSENIYRRQKHQPTPKRPNTFRSVVDLSTTVFQDELFKKLKPSKKEKKT